MILNNGYSSKASLWLRNPLAKWSLESWFWTNNEIVQVLVETATTAVATLVGLAALRVCSTMETERPSLKENEQLHVLYKSLHSKSTVWSVRYISSKSKKPYNLKQLIFLQQSKPVWVKVPFLSSYSGVIAIFLVMWEILSEKTNYMHLNSVRIVYIFVRKGKWVWSGNTLITHCRPTQGTVRKSYRTFTVAIHL